MSCANCALWPDGIGSIRAAYAFNGPIRESVHRFKYQGEFARAGFLSELMFHGIFRPEFVESPAWDLVAFVPLHKHRRRQRGFDQAELLSRHLSQQLSLDHAKSLHRTIDTPSQVGRGEAERQANVQGAFTWKGETLAGAKILLIDDVITTGATMVAAATALLSDGADRVDGFALARELLS